MNPGRDLDVLIAEKVLGKRVIKVGTVNGSEPICRAFSTDIESAWFLAHHMVHEKKYEYFNISVDTADFMYGGWSATFGSYDSNKKRGEANGTSAPHAICLAALKTLETNY